MLKKGIRESLNEFTRKFRSQFLIIYINTQFAKTANKKHFVLCSIIFTPEVRVHNTIGYMFINKLKFKSTYIQVLA